MKSLKDKELKLKAANGTDIPYSGWIELKFKLLSGVDVKNNCAITVRPVPFLISPSKEVNCVILGINVIKEMLNSSDMNDTETAELLMSMMKASFMETKPQKVEALVNFIQSNVLISSDLRSVKQARGTRLSLEGKPRLFSVEQTSLPHQENFLFYFKPDIEPLLMSDFEVNQTPKCSWWCKLQSRNTSVKPNKS